MRVLSVALHCLCLCLQLEAANQEMKDMLVFLKESLSDRVEKVVLTDRLLDSPCALVTSKFGWSANMERIMRSQAMGDSRAMDYMRGRKILEINPQHEIVRGIKVGNTHWSMPDPGLNPANSRWIFRFHPSQILACSIVCGEKCGLCWGCAVIGVSKAASLCNAVGLVGAELACCVVMNDHLYWRVRWS